MNIEQAKNRLTLCDFNDNTVEYYKALNIAIKSLDMWDKVIEEIEHLTYYWCEVNPKSVIDDVLQILEKYKKEIEE